MRDLLRLPRAPAIVFVDLDPHGLGNDTNSGVSTIFPLRTIEEVVRRSMTINAWPAVIQFCGQYCRYPQSIRKAAR